MHNSGVSLIRVLYPVKPHGHKKPCVGFGTSICPCLTGWRTIFKKNKKIIYKKNKKYKNLKNIKI
jgi:hypothetical protein